MTKARFVAGAARALSLSVSAQATETRRSFFGTLPDGRAVEAVMLSNGRGMRATVISCGAILQSVIMPDRAHKSADVALGYADMTGDLKAPNYFGATIGRYANRIKRGRQPAAPDAALLAR